jgi:type I pantothenate kinase
MVFCDPESYFRVYADLDAEETTRVAKDIWTRINLENLRQNIAPTRPRASLILTKDADHRIEEVSLRKL